MVADPTQIDLEGVSADVEALLSRAGYQGPVEGINLDELVEELNGNSGFNDFGFDGASVQRLSQTGYVSGRQTHQSGVVVDGDANDPNSNKARTNQAYQVAGQTAAITQQLQQITFQLTQQISVLTNEIASLEAQDIDLARQEGVLGQEIEIQEQRAAEAEADFDAATDAYEAAHEARAEAAGHAEELENIAESGGLTDAWVTAHVRDQQLQAQQEAQMAAYAQYGASRIQGEAMLQAEIAETELAQLTEQRAAISNEIRALTEELNLSEAQLEALQNEDVINSIASGEITPQEAIDGVTVTPSGSLTTIAADADGLGVSSEISLSQTYQTAAKGPTPEVAPEPSQADLVIQRAQEAAMAAKANTFAPA